MENWFLRLRCKDEGIVGSFKRPAPSPNESSPANAANHTVPTGQASLNEKNLLKQNAWQAFPVLIRSLAAPDCGVGGVRTLVQTSNSEAFYTFSFRLFFDVQPAENHQLHTYPQLSFKTASRSCSLYIYFVGASGVSAVNQGPHETSWLPTL